MNHCSKTVAIAIMVVSVAFAAVLKFDPFSAAKRFEGEMKEMMNLVMKPSVLSRYIPSDVYAQMGFDPSTRLTAYSWSNCGNKSEENFIIHDIEFSPDPLVFPGTLSVSFDLSLNITVEHIKADVIMAKKMGSGWFKLPCLDEIGSCHYDDVCELLSQITQCPPQFESAGVPCKCPLKKGEYKLPVASFEVDAGFLPSGDYHIRANLTNEDNVYGGCYDIYASFA